MAAPGVARSWQPQRRAADKHQPLLLGSDARWWVRCPRRSHLPLLPASPPPVTQVMEYLPGGDMMTLLIRKEILPEHWARFYLAQARRAGCSS